MISSGSPDSPNVLPGGPGCLPGFRPVFSRSDRPLLFLVYGLSDDGGFDEFDEPRPSLHPSCAIVSACPAITASLAASSSQ
jgi:hypothetical protein